MPTYAYACTACEHRFEAVQAFTDASLTDCPECQGRLRKLFNSVGIVFKGSGFYRTDSRAAATSAESKSTAESSSKDSSAVKSDSGSSAKSDSTSSASSSAGTSSSTGSSTAAKAAP